MAAKTRKPLSTKKATILERKALRDGRAEYIVLSSDGKTKYVIESINHVIQDCPCAHHQIRKVVCYHMRSCQIRELEIEEQEQQAAALAAYDIQAEADQVARAAEARLDADMYEVLAATKKVSSHEYSTCVVCGERLPAGKVLCWKCGWGKQ